MNFDIPNFPECSFCSVKYNPSGKWDFEKEQQKEMVHCFWASLLQGVDKENRPFIVAMGDDVSERYYPKFCPECGKRLD